jgi:C-terminal processing protease CtpA/Prc
MNINIVKSRVVINEIVKDSFAYNLGVRPDMIITKIDDRLISDMTFREVYDRSWFFTVKELTIIDDGVERTIKGEASVDYGL